MQLKLGSEIQQKLQPWHWSHLRYAFLLEYPYLPDESLVNHAKRISSDVKTTESHPKKHSALKTNTNASKIHSPSETLVAVIDGFYGCSEEGINFKFSRHDGQ